ncbi:hypothetical protein SAM23877_5026 [Streptomyces ambofaciens ATCC 23877]|uniref:Uncharacterized protein n=1 Tax=Streptomyces ambofaciens (strain ATCC 23877 / 3486 / DSM 40053 / JCM 4204 / NBRC 12836 / NRRL B-2516) TaxID=278992 RepID=A0A0K2AYU9_STRA7|nr:hypothetical protein SAM23877_5026 [Streptomyces ambofaciens ATCC 23877]
MARSKERGRPRVLAALLPAGAPACPFFSLLTMDAFYSGH